MTAAQNNSCAEWQPRRTGDKTACREEPGTEGKQGRQMYIGAFDIGGTKTIIALADETGKIYEKEQFVTDTRDCREHLAKCCAVFEKQQQKRGLSAEEISAVGVNLPGIVDRESGVLLRAVYAGWMNIPVKEWLGGMLGIKRIVCENDVNSCALGELRFGLGKQYKSFGWMTVSTGVGGAVVCDGRLIRGAHGYAGEFGHLKVEYEKMAKCPCGQEGCLEAHGSGTALTRMILEAAQLDPAYREAFVSIGEAPSGAANAKLAEAGNRKAMDIFEKAGEYLGRGISYYTNILDPEAVIIGGGVAASLQWLMPGIQRSIDRYTFAQMQDVKILPTALGYEAAMMGAIAIAAEEAE